MPPKLTGQREADTAHYRRIERYVALLEAIFDLSASRTASLVSGVEHDPEKLFKFSQHPELKAHIDALMSALAADVQAVIVNGATAEWENSNVKSDALVRSFLGDHADEERFKKFFNNNSDALAQFIKRKDSGMNLSTRVWNLTQAHKRDLELALSVGLGDGRSADELSRDIRKYLRDPDKLFRRVRDKFGNLVLSKPARAYKPGAGVYRSSYKNAVRLARTEINMAYKASDHARWQQLDFVVGYEVKRSQRKYPCDVCEALKGRYPKSFKFVSWHPNCRCYVVPILMTDDEFWSESDTSVNEVKDVPDGFKQWVADNKDRIVAAEKDGRLPYFLRDNEYQQYLPKYTQLGLREVESLVKGGADSSTRFTGKNGEWLPERTELHSKIVADYLNGGSTQTGTVYMLGGAPANGKSTLVDSGILPHPKGVLTIDPDAIKAMIPEYSRMLNSGNDILREAAARFTHEESSYMSKKIQEELRNRKLDFVLDGVNDGSFEKLSGKLSEMRNVGMKIRADYVSLDADLSIKLAVDRAKRTGRHVRLDFVEEMNREVSRLVPEIIKNKAVDELYLWDTNVNGKPRLILEQINGKLKIHDQSLYDAFLAKYRR